MFAHLVWPALFLSSVTAQKLGQLVPTQVFLVPGDHRPQFGHLPSQLPVFPTQIPKTTEQEKPIQNGEEGMCGIFSWSFHKNVISVHFFQIQSPVIGDKKMEQKIKTVK